MRRLTILLALLLAACADSTAPPSDPQPPGATPTPVPVARTWVSVDTHVHATGCGGAAPPENLVSWFAAQGIDVGAALVWGGRYDADIGQFSGLDHPASLPDRILHFDLEVSGFPAQQTGHLNLLGLREIVFSGNVFATPATGIPIVDWARAQDPRVTVGYAHSWDWPSDGSFPVPSRGFNPPLCCSPFEFPVEAARGRVHFLETDRDLGPLGHALPSGTEFLWHHVQNAGFRVALTGGSDLFCLNGSPGDIRTLVAIEGGLSYDAVLAGIRAGRTVVSIGGGSRIEVTVRATTTQATARIGDELRIPAGTELEVSIDSAQPQSDTATITFNGAPIHSFPVGSQMQTQSHRFTPTRSGWLAVRSDYLQTSAVYVIVDGAPIRTAASACYLRRYVDHLIQLSQSGAFPLGSTDEAIPAYQEARAILDQRVQEAGGSPCN